MATCRAPTASRDGLGRRVRRRPMSRGVGLFGLVGGLFVFLLLMLFAVQLTFNLFARSQVTAAGYDAARDVAGYDNDLARAAAATGAEARLRQMLGGMGREIVVTWDLGDPDVVRLRLQVRPPSVAPPLIRGAPPNWRWEPPPQP